LEGAFFLLLYTVILKIKKSRTPITMTHDFFKPNLEVFSVRKTSYIYLYFWANVIFLSPAMPNIPLVWIVISSSSSFEILLMSSYFISLFVTRVNVLLQRKGVLT
jgi:hypothetical protein